jgi:hypothetical protein
MSALPTPPYDAVMPVVEQRVMVALMVPTVIVAVGLAVRSWRNGRDAVPALCLLGGGVCVFLEPIIDVLGGCWYPSTGQQATVLETLGRPIPWWALLGYVMYMGGGTVVVERAVRTHGPTIVWRLFPAIVAFELIFEFWAVRTGTYVYYGRQPLVLFDFPLWWAFVNTSVPLVAGLAVARCRPLLAGRAGLGLLLLIPTIDAAANLSCAWPTYNVIGSHAPMPVVQAAGVLTSAWALLTVAVAVTLHRRSEQPSTPEVRRTGSCPSRRART